MQDTLTYDVPLVSSRYLDRFLRFLKTKRISEEVVITHNSAANGLINKADSYLSVNQVILLLESAQWLLNDEKAPFEFGQQLDIGAHGLFGYMLLSRENYPQLIESVVKHLRVCLPLFDMEVLYSGSEVVIRLNDKWELGAAKSFIAKVYMGSIYTIASTICKEIRFECDFKTGKNQHEWGALAPNTEWAFKAKYNQVTFPDLRQPVHRKTKKDDKRKVVYSLAENRHRAELQGMFDRGEGAGHITAKVRDYVLKTHGQTNIEQCAERLGMSARYLRQQLAKENASFREISNEIRQSYADLYLLDTPMPISEISNKLGFGDQASFTRAYRNWTGKTPGEARKTSK
ncbi:AraC family transcriptional regulator [Alkalimarinus coralli]|uniref:AraC family transcriptional regulator n=1 Tax=Alkalimarinus coralli TaxID=2935863 RepID=UPI00202B2104|nr:AraC family transcriptional regulator [Alkalimarinus coralli]